MFIYSQRVVYYIQIMKSTLACDKVQITYHFQYMRSQKDKPSQKINTTTDPRTQLPNPQAEAPSPLASQRKHYLLSFQQFASSMSQGSEQQNDDNAFVSQPDRNLLRKFSKRNKKQHKMSSQMQDLRKANMYKNESLPSFIDEKARQSQEKVDINGLKVYFPYKLYDIQKTYISKVIQAINQSQNALLESPTGTGKTLCLLSACLSWIWAQKNQGRHRRIIYLSRTHSQLQQVQKQIKTTCFRPTIGIVGSRDHLCLKQQFLELKGRQKMQACSKGVKLKTKYMANKINLKQMQQKEREQTLKNICNYYHQKSAVVEMGVQNFSNKLYTMSEFKQEGQKMKFCPYYYPFYMDEYSDMFIMPYNYILDADLLPRFANMISNSIVIFDQAHNVAEASCEGRSYQFLSSNIKGAQAEIQKIMYSPKPSQSLATIRKTNNKDLHEILQFLQDLSATVSAYVDELAQEQPNDNTKLYKGEQSKTRIKVVDKKQIELAIYELLNGKIIQSETKTIFKGKSYHYNSAIHELILKIQRITATIDRIIEELKETQDGIFHNIEKLSTFWKKVALLLQKSIDHKDNFIQNEINHFRLIFRIQINEDLLLLNGKSTVDSFEIQLRCLVPWLTFGDILAYSPKCILFTSGTMSPLQSWQNQLRIQAKVKLSNSHIINKSQVKLNVVCASQNGIKFDFRYKSVNENKKLIYLQLIQSLSLLCQRVPNGVIIICPNFRTVKELKFYISSENLSYTFQKRIIYQEKGSQKYIQLFKEQSQQGAVLICVCRGRASQGIDFPDHLCRAVIFVGIPFPNIRDPVLIQKKQHLQLLERHQKSETSSIKHISWEQWYFNGTMRAVNQGLGRVIRHAHDYGMLFLMDERYKETRYINNISSWIKGSIQIWKQITPIKLKQVQDFYKRNKANLPQPKHVPLPKKQKKYEKAKETVEYEYNRDYDAESLQSTRKTELQKWLYKKK